LRRAICIAEVMALVAVAVFVSFAVSQALFFSLRPSYPESRGRKTVM